MPGTPIDPAMKEFLESGVSILLAGRDAALVPSLSRGYGCRVDQAGLTILACRRESAQLIADIADTGAIAAVFSRPTDYRTFQIKGNDARMVAADEALLAIPNIYLAAFCGELERIGVQPNFREAIWDALRRADLIALRFTPDAIYRQTPGPGAGEPLAAS